MRWAKKRDQNEPLIFSALQLAGCEPERFDDFDIGARHCDGYGVMLEIKMAKGRLRDRQERLQTLFGERYRIARTVESALAACGIQVRKTDEISTGLAV
jgi:hypothetical protein